MRTCSIMLYTFDELNDAAKATAIDALRDINTDHAHWHDYVFDDFKRMAALIGVNVELKDIYFTGFSSQGDGACFTGSYAYKAGAVEAVKAEAPQDQKLHAVAEALEAIQARANRELRASVKHTGRYYHSRSTDIQVERIANYEQQDVALAQHEAVAEALRDLMDWLYANLEREYTSLQSDEMVKETIEANEYEFTAEGKLH